jgi:hypothetical protein
MDAAFTYVPLDIRLAGRFNPVTVQVPFQAQGAVTQFPKECFGPSLPSISDKKLGMIQALVRITSLVGTAIATVFELLFSIYTTADSTPLRRRLKKSGGLCKKDLVAITTAAIAKWGQSKTGSTFFLPSSMGLV